MGLFNFSRTARTAPASDVPRVYAIGDVHGRADLFEKMIDLIQADVVYRASRSTRIVVLGDFIDRGPSAAEMIELLMRLRKEPNLIVLKGNHEAAMVDALGGDFAALDLWIAHGGLETLQSYGVAIDTLDLDDGPRLLRTARSAIPKKALEWLGGLPTHVAYGGHYFVHAGIKPGIALDDQDDANRLWITDEFTDSLLDHGAVIVHGHTINEQGVLIAANRIGVDTGAYRTGKLSAVAIEGGRSWVLTAQ